jgi:hypothetical protein
MAKKPVGGPVHEEKIYKIRYGNGWLLTDDNMTKIEFVDDRSIASVHTHAWAARFQFDRMRNHRQRMEMFTLAEVEAMSVRERDDKLKRAWLNQFEASVRATYETTYTSEGFWCNAHMLHGMNLSVPDAVIKIGDKQHLRLTTKNQTLTLEGVVVKNADDEYVGEFDGPVFVPSNAVLAMTGKVQDWIENGAYALPGAPKRPTETEREAHLHG